MANSDLIEVNEKPRAYSYLRFSTPDQKKGDSYRRQKQLALDWVRANNAELDERSYEDLGVSAFRGANAETGMLGEFKDAVKSGLIAKGSYLLIESLDRLSRANPREATRLLEDICREGITVVTLSDGKVYDDNALDQPTGFLYAYITAIRAHEESESKSRRLKAAWANKRSSAVSQPMTTIAPAWIRLDAASQSFQLIADRADVVREIFELSADGLGQHGIAAHLNSQGVPTFGKSKGWHRTYVKKILENPAAMGSLVPHTLRYKDGKRVRQPEPPIEGYYPAAVSKDLYDAVQSQSGEGRAPPVRKTGVAHLLAGLAKCGCCGETMTRVNKGKRSKPVLVCTKAKRGLGCEYHAVRVEQIDTAIVSQAGELVGTAPSMDLRLDRELEAVELRHGELIDELNSLFDLIARRGTSALLEDRLRSKEVEYQLTKNEMDRLKKELAATENELLSSRLARLEELLKMQELHHTKANVALRSLLKTVTIDWRQGSLDFEWKHGGWTTMQYDFSFSAFFKPK